MIIDNIIKKLIYFFRNLTYCIVVKEMKGHDNLSSSNETVNVLLVGYMQLYFRMFVRHLVGNLKFLVHEASGDPASQWFKQPCPFYDNTFVLVVSLGLKMH